MAEKFVCVRIIKCNTLDLRLFQFDYDLTFATFFLNADKIVYARYGVRNSLDADADVHVDGLRATMKSVLDLHRNYPSNNSSLGGKQPKETSFARPEDYRMLRRFKPDLDYDGPVSKSCIHCHQIRDAQRQTLRTAGKPLPEELMFPYPSIRSLGFELDTKTRATVTKTDESIFAGPDPAVRNGDTIDMVNGQPICSAADLSWVLHNSKSGDTLQFVVTRNEKQITKSITLPASWRSSTDISWRPTSWDVRRMATGGITLTPIEKSKSKLLGIDDGQMALEITHVGQYGAHARAKRAGFKKGDIVVAFDGKNDLLTESKVFEYAVQRKRPGDRVRIEVLRDDEPATLEITIE